jgi:RTX calcium-binding nonapeptide repeat (4 copies)
MRKHRARSPAPSPSRATTPSCGRCRESRKTCAHGARRPCGDAGKDQISGGKGDDVLIGGPGKDTLKGGPDHNRIHQ